MKYILAIDQGTTGSTAVLIDTGGKMVGKANREYRQIYPQPGWVEHNPDEIWESVTLAIRDVLQATNVSPSNIEAIGITNQRETTVIWDRVSGKPIYNAIVWQCRRTADFCKKLKAKGLERTFKSKTGLVLDPYFSGTKIRWILDHVSGAKASAQKGQLAFGNIDSFLMWKMSDGNTHSTDTSNASRTLLMNLKTLQWDPELCKALGVPVSLLPQICSSIGKFGETKNMGILPDGIPITGVAGDQQAALFGQTCFSPGEAKCTFGTGSFLVLNTGSKIVPSKSGCLTTVGWTWNGKTTYALEGSAFICGAAVQWLRDGLKIISSSSEIEALASKVEDCGGVQLVPAFTGLGAPYWDPNVRAVISGLTRGSNSSHIARATLEGMALQNVDLLIAMQKDLGKKLKALKVDGGAAANNLLMQMQSDFLGADCIRPEVIETTAAGAGYLAGLGHGIWSNYQDISKIWKINKKFQPQISAKSRSHRVNQWHDAIQQCRQLSF